MQPYEFTQLSDDELMHYGRLGMKWYQHVYASKQKENTKLRRRAIEKDIAKAKAAKKAEQTHYRKDVKKGVVTTINKSFSKEDQKKSVKDAVKANKQKTKAYKIDRKLLNTPEGKTRDKLESKSAKLKYQSEKNQNHADMILRYRDYGKKAKRYAVASNKASVKAAKYRYKIAKNQRYMNTIKKKLDTNSLSHSKKKVKACMSKCK